MKKTVLQHLGPGMIRQSGPLGKMLDLSIANRLKKVDYVHLVDPFRFRYETDNAWRCEFWGKVLRSAILSWCGNRDPELLQIIKSTVNDMLSTQTPDGCISSYPAEKQTSGWVQSWLAGSGPCSPRPPRLCPHPRATGPSRSAGHVVSRTP